MHGSRPLVILLLAAVLSLSGCAEMPPPASESGGTDERATTFDPATTGTVRGQVRWEGPAPKLPPIQFVATAYNPLTSRNPGPRTSPHLPQVDPSSGGLDEAVVYLRGVDPRKARPWDHGPVQVEFTKQEIHVRQAGQGGKIGFVRRGDAITAMSRDAEYHCLRARGAAAFAIPFPEARYPATWTLSQPGHVELSSGAGYYWMRGHLFVDDHPYYVRSDTSGQFALEQVPAGTYELVCWVPNWHVVRGEREPETGVIARYVMAAPQVQVQTIRVEAGRSAEAAFAWRTEQFPTR